MIIYRLSVVDRNFPPGHPDSKIENFREDYEFHKLSRLEAKRDQVLKRGETDATLDITVWETDSTRSYYDYNGTLDTRTLKDKGY